MPKRKSVSSIAPEPAFSTPPIPLPLFERAPASPPAKRRASGRKVSKPAANTGSTNLDKNANVLDAPEALRASPDASEADERMNVEAAGMDVDQQVKKEDDERVSSITDKPKKQDKAAKKGKRQNTSGEGSKDDTVVKTEPAPKPQKTTAGSEFQDPEAEGDDEADEEELQAAFSRAPPVHSDYLPLPWKGRLGYVSQFEDIQKILLTEYRLASIHIFAFPTPRSLVLGHVALPPS